MYKKFVKNFVLAILVFFGFNIYVNADGIDNLQTGDIIIGNTVFKSGTWISATRAGKAGSLYTKNTGSIDVRTFSYINENVWYELGENGEYIFLNSSQIEEVKNNISIYYNNNEGILHTYDLSERYYFFEEIYEIEDDVNFEYKYDDKSGMNMLTSVTCPYDKVFEFKEYYETENGYDVINMIGKCGMDDNFDISIENYYSPSSINIKSIELVNDQKYRNNSKVSEIELEEDPNDYYKGIQLKVNEKLIDYIPSYESVILYEDKYVVIDLKFDEGNSAYSYDIISDYYWKQQVIDKNTLRIYIPMEETISTISNREYIWFTIFDYEKKEFEEFYVLYEGVDKETEDFEITSISVAETSDYADYFENMSEEVLISLNENQSKILGIDTDTVIQTDPIESEFKETRINVLGELNSVNGSQYLILKLETSIPIYETALIINLTKNGEYIEDYEYYITDENEILLILNALNETTYLSINYYHTTGNSNDGTFISINSFDENNYIEYDKSFLGVYHYDGSTNLLEKVPINYGNYSDIYYDSENNRLYYNENAVETIFKDEDSFKSLLHSKTDTIEVKELVGLLYNVTDNSYRNLYSSSEFNNFDDSIFQSINEDKEYKLYYFFNRLLTAEEENVMITIENVYNNIETVNLSNEYYDLKELKINAINKYESSSLSEITNNQNKIIDSKLEENTFGSDSFNLYYFGELENVVYNNKTGKYVFLEVDFDDEIDVNNLAISYGANDYHFVENGKLILGIIPKENDRTLISITAPGQNYLGVYIYFNSYLEENYIEYDANNVSVHYKVADRRYSTDLPIVKSTSASLNHNDIYYDSLNNKMYYKENAMVTIFKDDTSFKMLSKESEEYYVRELVYVLYEVREDVGNYSLGVTRPSTETRSTFESLYNTISTNSEKNYELYYFFNRNMTETERTNIEKISALENVEIYDVSEKYYVEK